jgi:hypothetical protein
MLLCVSKNVLKKNLFNQSKAYFAHSFSKKAHVIYQPIPVARLSHSFSFVVIKSLKK